MNKKEYIKHLKSLIKKYHPDLHANDYPESMYNEITKILVNKLNNTKINETAENRIISKNEHGLIRIKEQDYAYYKLGIKYYRNIHPNRFYKRNPDSTYETKKYDELVSALNKIYLSFNLSRHYFGMVTKNYPQSPYCEDSAKKINLLEKLSRSYTNAILYENKTINSEKFIAEMGLKLL